MEDREIELSNIQLFIEKVDTELTMILQHLQWDKKHLLEDKPMVDCKHDKNHRIPEGKFNIHEKQCLLMKNGYRKEDMMLPDPLNAEANTLVKLNKVDITQVINKAAYADPLFRKERHNLEPLTLGRLQETYTPDERRAIHDAVVTAAPFCHDLSDLALPSTNAEESSNVKAKSRVEILAELRDMKRRRTKYRVAAKTRNYSDVLRDVIKTQMEVYSDVKTDHTSNSKHRSNENITLQDKHHSSKQLRYSPYKDERESGHEYRRNISRDKYNDYSSNSTRKQSVEPIQYPNPRQRDYEARRHKEEKYHYKGSTSNSGRNQIYDQKSSSSRRDFYDREIKEERYDEDRSSSSKKTSDDVDQDSRSKYLDHSKRKYKEERDRSSKSRYHEKYYKDDDRSEEYKKSGRKRGDSSKSDRKYDKRKEERHRKERYDLDSDSSRDSKKRYKYDDFSL